MNHNPVDLEAIKYFRRRLSKMLTTLLNISCQQVERKACVYSQKELAELCHREPKSVARAVAQGHISPPETQLSTRMKGFNVNQLLEAQTYFNASPGRDKDNDKCAVIAFINAKGGVAKSELSCNTARDFAKKGYRGCIIDMDHQASATSSFGLIPDLDFSHENTILPYLEGEQETLDYALQDTDWPNLKLIPACMALNGAEFELIIESSRIDNEKDRVEFYSELSRGIDTIKDQFDFILIDSPPTVSVSSISILIASDALVIPSAAAKPDLSSTVQFLDMLIQTLEKIAPEKQFDFMKLLVTKYSNVGFNDKTFYDGLRQSLGVDTYEHVFRTMSVIKDASALFMTIFEMPGVQKSVFRELSPVFGQIETDMLRMWPSKNRKLEEMAIA